MYGIHSFNITKKILQSAVFNCVSSIILTHSTLQRSGGPERPLYDVLRVMR